MLSLTRHPFSVLLALALISVAYGAHGQEELPFWRKNKKLYRQIENQRRVVVAVKEESSLGQKKFRMTGVGAVNVPLYYSVKRVMEFERLPDVSSYFKKVVHKKEKKQIYLVMEALGYQARMLLEYKWQNKGEDLRQMDWHVIYGPFKGMVGHYQFRAIDSRKTEVSLWSTFVNPQLPVPEFLMKFTLEVIAEKVAQKMRSFIESEYRTSQK
ncbi:MAG: hypothetical protein HRT44_12495 [Bdellovibrionales bacterium]|nr:hypothetical protein [Bdellovibrionales bacterium]